MCAENVGYFDKPRMNYVEPWNHAHKDYDYFDDAVTLMIEDVEIPQAYYDETTTDDFSIMLKSYFNKEDAAFDNDVDYAPLEDHAHWLQNIENELKYDSDTPISNDETDEEENDEEDK